MEPFAQRFDRFCRIGLPTGLDEDLLGRVRARQLETIRSLTPVMMCANILNAIIIAVTFLPVTNAPLLLAWTSVAVALALLAIRQWRRFRARPPKPTASARAIRAATVNAGVLGLVWVAPTILFVQDYSPEHSLLAAMVVGGMACAGGFALASIPSAAIMYVGIVGASGFAGLIARLDWTVLGLIAIYANYCVVVIAIITASFQTFISHFLAEVEKARLAEAEIGAMRAWQERNIRIEQQIGVFARAIERVLVQMGEVSAELSDSSQALGRAAEQVEGSSRSATSEAQAAEIAVSRSAGAADRMRASIGEIARRTARSAEVGENALTRTAVTVEAVSSVTAATSKIENVVALIQSIAAQTNMLALNATIEAARAGSAGRGFAVVAGEVKQLAEQTARATQDIASQIRQIDDAALFAAGTVSDLRGIVEAMSAAAKEIAQAVNAQTLLVAEIADGATLAADGVQRTVEDIGKALREAAGAGTVGANAQRLAVALQADAEELERAVSKFLGDVRAA
jgi:methyl-accepting chemotaxis protein